MIPMGGGGGAGGGEGGGGGCGGGGACAKYQIASIKGPGCAQSSVTHQNAATVARHAWPASAAQAEQ